MNLSKSDYILLKFIKENEPVQKDKIIESLKGKVSAIDTRLYELGKYKTTRDSFGFAHTEHNNLVAISEKGFWVTEPGRVAIENYDTLAGDARKERWFNGVWCPVIVTVIINLLIAGIKPLLPLILQWFSSSP